MSTWPIAIIVGWCVQDGERRRCCTSQVCYLRSGNTYRPIIWPGRYPTRNWVADFVVHLVIQSCAPRYETFAEHGTLCVFTSSHAGAVGPDTVEVDMRWLTGNQLPRRGTVWCCAKVCNLGHSQVVGFQVFSKLNDELNYFRFLIYQVKHGKKLEQTGGTSPQNGFHYKLPRSREKFTE